MYLRSYTMEIEKGANLNSLESEIEYNMIMNKISLRFFWG